MLVFGPPHANSWRALRLPSPMRRWAATWGVNKPLGGAAACRRRREGAAHRSTGPRASTPTPIWWPPRLLAGNLQGLEGKARSGARPPATGTRRRPEAGSAMPADWRAAIEGGQGYRLPARGAGAGFAPHLHRHQAGGISARGTHGERAGLSPLPARGVARRFRGPLPAPTHCTGTRPLHGPTVTDDRRTAASEVAATLAEARDAAKTCRRCPLWHDATQTVFGEGPQDAEVVFVGEAAGRPGGHRRKALRRPGGQGLRRRPRRKPASSGTRPMSTNAVKHFKFERRGKRRLHSDPTPARCGACRWWLDKELGFIRQRIAVALGATAALALDGRALPVTMMRGAEGGARGRARRLPHHPSLLHPAGIARRRPTSRRTGAVPRRHAGGEGNDGVTVSFSRSSARALLLRVRGMDPRAALGFAFACPRMTKRWRPGMTP